MTENFNKMRELAVRVFKSKDGEDLLKEMEKHYMLNSPVAPHFESSNYAYFREGENNIIRTIRKLIEE